MNDRITSEATRILAENWRGLYTVPAGGLYPHQWSWDSAFIAIGLRHISPRRAQQELDSLLAAQWADGRIPQIVFNPRRDDDYSPGAAFWRSETIPGSPSVPTSGLIQPPNHALAVWMIHEVDRSESRRRGFLERAYPRLVSWHRYLRGRRAGAAPLMRIVHPWESGMDNSPYWDAPLAAVSDTFDHAIPRPDLLHAHESHRPSNDEYAKYLYLAARYRDAECNDDVEHPFLVEDPAVNALWARSELALAEMAEELGADGAQHRDQARAITEAIEQLWEPDLGCYTARDLLTGANQQYRTVAGLVPLLLPDLAHTDELLATLNGPHFRLGETALVPSHDLTAETFDSSRYWRGPSWFNTAWLIAEALQERGLAAEARSLASSMAELAVRNDFPEYLDPYSGEPRGTLRFSWTAALSLDAYRRLIA